jgi:Cu(I)/Ag(I) efflux system membrane protein CusA/SilA
MIAGLLPILICEGVGAAVMGPIAAPMVGGKITAPLMSLFVIPAIYLLWQGRKFDPQPRDHRPGAERAGVESAGG